MNDVVEDMTILEKTDEYANALAVGRGCIAHICELNRLQNEAIDDEDWKRQDEIMDRILETPYSVEVRTGWCNAYEQITARDLEEVKLTLAGGGPAVRLIAKIEHFNGWMEVGEIEVQVQDWFLPWRVLPVGNDTMKVLEWFVQMFPVTETY